MGNPRTNRSKLRRLRAPAATKEPANPVLAGFRFVVRWARGSGIETVNAQRGRASGCGARNYIAISGSAVSFLVSGISVIVASVRSSTLATETAFSSAMRTTLVGSMMPASTRST